jgi:hypothetical protein
MTRDFSDDNFMNFADTLDKIRFNELTEQPYEDEHLPEPVNTYIILSTIFSFILVITAIYFVIRFNQVNNFKYE